MCAVFAVMWLMENFQITVLCVVLLARALRK